jgi:hypothetical protein
VGFCVATREADKCHFVLVHNRVSVC